MSIWIELFYDLGFVAAILIISVAVAHVHPSSGIIWIVLVFAALWWVWFTTTICANRFHMVDLSHRLLLLFQMLVIVLMAMEARVSVAGDSAYLALEYGLLLLAVGFMYFRAARLDGSSDSGYAVRLAVLNAVSAVCFFVAVLLPESARLILSAASLVLLVIPSIIILQHVNDFSDNDEKHLADRMAAFTLIVCGESFVEIAISVSGATIDNVDVVALVFEFILVFALFTSYFDDIPAAGLNRGYSVGGHCCTWLRKSVSPVRRSRRRRSSISIRRTAARSRSWLTVPWQSSTLPLRERVCTRRRGWPLAVARVLTAVGVGVAGVARGGSDGSIC